MPRPSNSKLALIAVPTPQEVQQGYMERKVYASVEVFKLNGFKFQSQEMKRTFVFSSDKPQMVPNVFEKFNVFPEPDKMRTVGYNEHLPIYLKMEELLPEHIKNEALCFNGLINEGTTCYLNSLIQTLFFIRPFRNAIYQLQTLDSQSNPT